MSATQSAPVIEFPYLEWSALRDSEGKLVSVEPVKGTWTLLSPKDRQAFANTGCNIKALFACPNCATIGVIPEGLNMPKHLGDTCLLPVFYCRRGCQYACHPVLKDWDRRKLYCACYEDGGEGVKEYFHAEDETEARKFFWAQHGTEVLHLIGIAPVIGFFLENPKDDQNLVV